MGWIGYITSYMFYFTVSRDGKFSNMLRNDPKVERKKGSSLLALRLSFLSTWQVSYCAIVWNVICAKITRKICYRNPQHRKPLCSAFLCSACCAKLFDLTVYLIIHLVILYLAQYHVPYRSFLCLELLFLVNRFLHT